MKTKTDIENATWAKNKGRWFIANQTNPALQSGIYEIDSLPDGTPAYTEHPITSDQLLNFEGSLCDQLLTEIRSFWNSGDTFKEYNILQRRGYILYGPPGSGKTAISELIMQECVNTNCVVFICNTGPAYFAKAIQWFRKNEPKRKIVCLFEDVDSIIDEHGEAELLSCLDGENQVDLVLNLATTNYPEKLNPRIIRRPRRFDRIIKVGYPPEQLRRQYFTAKLRLPESEVNEWVKVTEDFSFAACTDLLINVKCFGYPLNESAQKVRKTMTHTSNSSDLDFNN